MAIRFFRRRFLTTAAAGAGAFAMPYLSRAADRPQITHGVQSGDVGADGGVVWARADRPSQMMVEVATTESFKDARCCRRSQPCPKATSPPRCCWKISRPGRTSSTA
jgi:alkaline phosphatase D